MTHTEQIKLANFLAEQDTAKLTQNMAVSKKQKMALFEQKYKHYRQLIERYESENSKPIE